MKKQQIPQLLLEQYLLNELSPEKKVEIERLISHSPELQGELDALKKSNEEILDQYNPVQMVAEIKGRGNVKTASPLQAMIPRIAMVLVIPILIFAGYRFLTTPSIPIHRVNYMGSGIGTEHINIKGEYGIKVIRKDGNHQHILTGGATAGEGDLIQLKYVIKEGNFGLLLSLDGNGSITIHLPADGTTNLRGKLQGIAPRAYELDDAPDFERFFMVVSNHPINIDDVQEQLKQLKNPQTDPLTIDGAITVHHFLLKKPASGE